MLGEEGKTSAPQFVPLSRQVYGGQRCSANVAGCLYFEMIYLVLKDALLSAFGALSPASAGGWASNSVKPPGTTAPSEKSATAPQLDEQDTLVQRAEHIPAGKRTPMCAHCNQVIRLVPVRWVSSSLRERTARMAGPRELW